MTENYISKRTGMKRNSIVFLIMIMISQSGYGQNQVTLSECYDLAESNTGLLREKENYALISGLKDENIRKNLMPSLDLGGTFLYNSSVIDMGSTLGNLPFPGIADAIDPMPHEQYRLTLEVNQVIYDGGAVKNARALGQADLAISQKETDTGILRIRDEVTGYFFSILLLSRQAEVLNNYLDVINSKTAALQSAIDNGAALRSDLDVISSEKIKLEQQISENLIRKNALVRILSDLTGKAIDPSSRFVLPGLSYSLSYELRRPELDLLELGINRLDAVAATVESQRKPKAFGMATLGYGNPPGNNFLRDEFAPYYVLGAGLKWNIFDWDKTRNEKEILAVQKTILEDRRNDLSDNLKRLLDAKKAEIDGLNSLLDTDIELIALRKRITATAGSQYQNGTITATEYLSEMNAENQALLNHEIHKINLSLAMVAFMNISGQEIR